MPGKVGVKIKAGRNLPVMDRGSDTTDAYVEIKLGNTTHKTDVCRKTLNPQWNTDWYRFEVDDAELQDEPLQIRLMDHDTYSANDAIGKVNISLNPLCLENAGQSKKGKGAVMSGWIPVFDTMHGIRGEVNIIVKVDLFSDANKFRQSSCGIQFFHSQCIPHGYRAQVIHGFVEELVVNDDPEYQWIDKIRTPRASNEARQVVFLKLSGQVQRKIGLKAINLGANAVIGYSQCFDLEGDVGVVSRGIGTAVTLVKIQESINQSNIDSALIEESRPTDEFTKSKFDTDYSDLDPSNVVYKILGIEPIDKCSARSPNIIVKHKWKPSTKDGIIIEENQSENEGMRLLLEQEDMRGEKQIHHHNKFRHHVKKITNNSKSLINEKFNAFKARLNDEKLNENDTKSLNSSWSDLSFTDTARSSLTDLRNLMRFKKAKKQLKYQRSVSDGTEMATLLVSSIMHSPIRGPSLDSISEDHDSVKASSNLTKRTRTTSKSESMSNLLPSSLEDKIPLKNDIKEMKAVSMKNLSPIKFKKSPKPLNLLKPNVIKIKSDNSMSSISESCSTSSADDEDDDDADDDEDDEEEEEEEEEEISEDDEEECSETTTANETILVDPDTVSMVVKSVLAKGIEDSDNWIQPGSTHDKDDDIYEKPEKKLEKILQAKSNSYTKQASTDSGKSDETVALPANQQIIQTGATRILQKDKDSKITKSKIIENDTSYEKLGKMLKRPSIDEDEDNWIEPGSTCDEPETIDKIRRQSLLHDFRENITEKFHHLQEHMHMPHFSDNNNSKIIHKHGLLESAMETILIDKSNLMGVETTINSQKRRNSIDMLIKTLHLPFGHNKDENHKNDKTTLIGNAMNAMLMEPFNIAEEICHDSNKNEHNESHQLPAEIIIKNESTFDELNLPNSAQTTNCNLQKQTLQIFDNSNFGNFYSSEPELNDKILLSSSSLSLTYDNQSAPFLSLTNLNIQLNNNKNNNNNNNDNDDIDNKINKIIIPKAIIIHPSTPIKTPETPTSSLTFSFDEFNKNQDKIKNENDNLKNSKFNVIIKTIYLINDNNNKNNNKFHKNNNNNINNKSSSYTNLSCTNKAPMLVPSPYYHKKQLRSSTELVALGSTSPAIQQQQQQPTTAAVSSQSTMSAMTLTTGNLKAIAANSEKQLQYSVSPMSPLLIQGHNRAESVGGNGSGGGTSNHKIPSPAKLQNIGNNNCLTSTSTSTSATTNTANNAIPTNNKNQEIYRRSSDSDLSVTPKGNSICVASDRLVAATTMMRLSAPTSLKNTNPDNLDMLEYPFLTMARYPTGFILHLGATVAARSVKLLERVPNPDEPETRDSWWTELRMEIRSHARALGCNVILGYSEVTTISDDVCVLSATGTAAVINMSYSGETYDISTSITTSSSKKDLMVSSLDERECLRDLRNGVVGGGIVGGVGGVASGSGSGGISSNKENCGGSGGLIVSDTNYVTKEFSSSFGGTTKNFPNSFLQNKGCAMCHIPYSTATVPFNVKMKKCAVCKRGKVPDVLLATIEIPDCLQITGRGCFMQAQVVRAKKDLRSESNAKEISDGLPFLEYELHRLLINKLKAKGMNAIFGLKAHVAIGEKMMALIATGTAVFLTALPPPSVPKIVAGNSWHDTARLNDLQKSLQETVERNREIYQLKILDPDLQNGSKHSDTDDSDDELLEMDLNAGNKDTCVLEVDDIEDLEIISLLMEPCPPDGFHVVNTQTVPGLQDFEVVRNLQMFTQIWRAKLSVGSNNERFPKHFQRLLQTIYFKLRTMIPCAICDLKFRLDLPESDEIQLLVTGMALGLGEPTKLTKLRRKQIATNDSSTTIVNSGGGSNKKLQDDDLIFNLDDDQITESSSGQFIQNSTGMTNLNYGTHSLKLKKNSPSRTKFSSSSVRYSRHLPVHDRYGVDITPLSYVPGGKIEKYLGNLNFFFIRESTSIRENGGISGFVHSFITEILAVVRAHISALGGNAMVSFYMTELLLVDNQHKNQGQCLVSIGGDVVFVSYFADD